MWITTFLLAIYPYEKLRIIILGIDCAPCLNQGSLIENFYDFSKRR